MTAPASTTATTTPAANGLPGSANTEPENPHAAGSKEAVLADLAKERDRRQAAETKAKDFDTVQAELQRYKDQHQTAEQKQAEQLATLANERDTATVKALRYEVCADPEIALPLAASQFLTGSTKAEIEASAKALKALGAFSSQAPATGGLPPAPNAAREAKRPSGSEQGLAEAERRFGKKS